MADIWLQRWAARRQIRRERVFRDRAEILDIMDDTDLIRRYRFPRRVILELSNLVREDIERPTQRSHSLPVHLQVMVTLRFLAKDDYLSETGDLHGVSQSSACRCVEDVCTSLNRRLDNIKFPASAQQLRQVKEDFYQISNFPNVIGAIDGTLIPIQGMSTDEHIYVCRKGFHALNIQAVVDANQRFINLVCRYPGSTHDSFVLNNSGLPELMANNPEGGWLLGDSGYPLKPWLMTPPPPPRPATPKETRYNLSLCRTRNVIERAFGVLKARFRCIHKTGGSLPYKPTKCAKITETAFRLHNKALDERIPLPQGGQIVMAQNNDINNQQNNVAANIRRRLINRF